MAQMRRLLSKLTHPHPQSLSICIDSLQASTSAPGPLPPILGEGLKVPLLEIGSGI